MINFINTHLIKFEFILRYKSWFIQKIFTLKKLCWYTKRSNKYEDANSLQNILFFRYQG